VHGQGRVLVCCLRVIEGLKRGWPEAGYLLDCLIEYVASDRFHPATVPMAADEVQQVFRLDAAAGQGE
jgi:hypothetical protein